MNKRVHTIGHAFYCTQCGKPGIPIQRREGHLREAGHLKRLFCVSCNRVINHAECIENSKYDAGMFFEEFESGNFDTKGCRILPLSEWKHNRNKHLVL